MNWRCVNYGCRKSYASRSKARAHAAICPKDPGNRCCLTCANFMDGEVGGWEEPGYVPSCAKGLDVGGGYSTGEPLPRDCSAWELSDSQRKHNPTLSASVDPGAHDPNCNVDIVACDCWLAAVRELVDLGGDDG